MIRGDAEGVEVLGSGWPGTVFEPVGGVCQQEIRLISEQICEPKNAAFRVASAWLLETPEQLRLNPETPPVAAADVAVVADVADVVVAAAASAAADVAVAEQVDVAAVAAAAASSDDVAIRGWDRWLCS